MRSRLLTKGTAFAIALAVCTGLTAVVPAFADDGVETGYTYTYDFWDEVRYSPDAYEVVGVYTAGDLGLDTGFKNPDGLFVFENYVFVCDTGNSRILQWERTAEDKFTFVREIKEVKGIENPTLSGVTDIFIDHERNFYITDKGNERVLKTDWDMNYIMQFTKPTDNTFDQSLYFLPDKVVADVEGRVYLVSDNINKGIIKYESDGTFAGFYGAMPATYSWYEYIWKKLSSAAQRAAMESFVPTEYDNVAIDSEGFIYACSTNVSGPGLRNGSEEGVRRLNLLGNNILIQNGYDYVMGDVRYGNFAGYSGCSLFIDVTALDDSGIYFCLDKTRGRIFGYDKQGEMLFAFGGVGNFDGYFSGPVALEHMGTDLIVLDSVDNSFTVFSTTEYGDLIYKALEEYRRGDYIASGETWEEVRKLNGNYDLAYIGIGRSLKRQKKYKEALPYFKTKWDRDNYSKAFKEYRKEWVEQNIWWIFIVAFVLLVFPLGRKKIRMLKYEIDMTDFKFAEAKDNDEGFKSETREIINRESDKERDLRK